MHLWIKKENAVFAITGIQITENLHGDIGHINKNKWPGEKINAVVIPVIIEKIVPVRRKKAAGIKAGVISSVIEELPENFLYEE